MKITKHITFYYLENRIIYLNKIIDNTNKYTYYTDLYIHTNNPNFNISQLNNYTNGNINIIYHNLENVHPYYLTWQCRHLLLTQKHEYDIYIYIEDDILVPDEAIKYWLKYKDVILNMNYNLGFLRIEVNNNIEYITDLWEKLDTIINLNDEKYIVNNKNPYCAFWIYDNNEFNKFVNSKYYSIENIEGYGIREKSAIGLHGMHDKFYKNTLIPVINNKLISDCKIYHLPNNYVNDYTNNFATINFDDALII